MKIIGYICTPFRTPKRDSETLRCDGRAVRQRSAKPSTAVRFRFAPRRYPAIRRMAGYLFHGPSRDRKEKPTATTETKRSGKTRNADSRLSGHRYVRHSGPTRRKFRNRKEKSRQNPEDLPGYGRCGKIAAMHPFRLLRTMTVASQPQPVHCTRLQAAPRPVPWKHPSISRTVRRRAGRASAEPAGHKPSGRRRTSLRRTRQFPPSDIRNAPNRPVLRRIRPEGQASPYGATRPQSAKPPARPSSGGTPRSRDSGKTAEYAVPRYPTSDAGSRRGRHR